MKFYYTNPETGQKEEVAIERWQWGVIYDDDSELHQFEAIEGQPEGVFHRVGEIDQSRVKMAVMSNPATRQRIDMPFNKGMKLIHKYRNVRPYYLPDFVKVYMFGYQKGKQAHYTFILPDDRIIISPYENVDLVLFNLK